MDIQRKAFEESNNVNPDWSFKFDEELQQYVATDFEMTNQVDEFNEHWDTFRAGWEANAQAVQEWISVDDNLPNRQVNVLVASKHDFLCIASLTNNHKNNKFYDGDGFAINSITHWMPLPKPPKAQEPAND